MRKISMIITSVIIFSVIITSIAIISIVTHFGNNNRKGIITIKYAAWNLGPIKNNSIERQMIKAFNKSHANIKVQIAEEFVKNYNAALKEDATKNVLPDVFMYVSNPEANTKGWCADITNIVSKDNEWNNIPKTFREATRIKDKIIAVPMSIYLDGYFYNENLFKAQKVDLPPHDFSVNEFKSIVRKMTNINKGSIGLGDESTIIEWYPAAVNQKFGWYTWDGGKFNLNSSEFKAGVNLAKSIYMNKEAYASLSEAEKKILKGKNDWEAWNAGTVALKFDGSWSAGDYSKLPFKVGFTGIPGGRSCIVPDFLIINSKCKHPKEAYEFAKYMSTYSLEGFKERMKLANINHTIIASLPMIKDNKLIKDYFSTIKIQGLRTEYRKIQKSSYVEGVKVLPGYDEARWSYITNIKVGNTKKSKIGDVLTNTFRGSLKIENISSRLNSYANDSIQLFPREYEN